MKVYFIHKNPFLAIFLAAATLFSACQKESEVQPESSNKSARFDFLIRKVACISSITLGQEKTITFSYAKGKTKPYKSTISTGLTEASRGITTTEWTFNYDAHGYLRSVTGSDGQVIEVTTDADGNITGASALFHGYFAFSQTLTYNDSKQLTYFHYLLNSGDSEYTFTYQPDGNLESAMRTGSPSFYNFRIKSTGYDTQPSPWITAGGDIAFWWMATVTYHLGQTPGQWLSYKNNMTSYNFEDYLRRPFTGNVSYTYDSGVGYAASLNAICSDPVFNRGPYGFTYIYQYPTW